MPRPLLLALAAALALPASAQTFTREATPFPVTGPDGEVAFPFVGGFFEPRPELADIDADGDADLIVNVGGAGLQLFERRGDRYVWTTDRIGGIEPGNWSTFADLDGDGDLDLLARGEPGRVRYWRNVGTPQEAAFEIGAELLRDAAGEPVYVEDSSIPELADLDGDGDPDLFSGKADIGTITYYRHVGVENGVPVFEFVTDRFQDIVIYEENPQCRSAGTIESGPLTVPGRGSMRHGANAIAIQDVTGDGAPELFWGDFFAPSLFYFLNEGSPTDPQLALASERFPVGQPLTSGGYNAPTYGDADGDGDPDLVVGVQRGLCFQTQTAAHNLIYFENTGTAAAPDLQLRTDRLIDGIDVGSRSAVALADLDGDGDLDLVVANETNPDDTSRANLQRYENTGTATAPAFRLADPDWLALAYDFGAYAPVFGDLDGDGDLDLLVGGFNGRFAFLRNTGTAATPSYVREDDRWGGIDVGQYARATLGDVDGDGDLDLLGGASSGRVRLYRNVGTASTPAFETMPNGAPSEADAAYLLAIGLPERLDGDAAPAFSDIDGDGDLDVLIGTAQGTILVFQNVGTPTAPAFVAAEPVPAGRRRVAPTLGDLDGDGRPEIVAGTSSGGLLFWSAAGGVWTEPTPPGAPSDLGVRIVPNPSSGSVSVRADAPDGEVVVFDARGRVLARLALASGAVQWDGRGAGGPAAPGVYLAQVRADGATQTVPFTLVR
ncbi:FG-GAP-like repeat-containing protein [Rubrivirga sp. IMCC45206]|uniref:FG-GAP-like repeat-containing protein n=1 Tax=Rubrivirga sp. IMCC45206 TaxID=3391614 RepID=UPI00398FC462